VKTSRSILIVADKSRLLFNQYIRLSCAVFAHGLKCLKRTHQAITWFCEWRRSFYCCFHPCVERLHPPAYCRQKEPDGNRFDASRVRGFTQLQDPDGRDASAPGLTGRPHRHVQRLGCQRCQRQRTRQGLYFYDWLLFLDVCEKKLPC